MYKFGYHDRYLFFVNDYYEDEKSFQENPSRYRQEHRAYIAHGFIYVTQGSMKIRVEASQYILNAGDLLLIRESEAHTIQPVEFPCEYYDTSFSLHYFHIADPDYRLYDAITNRTLGIGNVIKAAALNGRLIQELLKSIALTTDAYTRRLVTMNALSLILFEANRVYQPQNLVAPYKRDSLTASVFDYINNNLQEELDPDHLAAKFYVSRSQLNRMVKSGTGFTLWHYITCKRLIRSYYLIRSGVSNKEAAALSGFQDYSTFYKAHIRVWRFSPKDYRPSDSFDPFLTNFYQLDEYCGIF